MRLHSVFCLECPTCNQYIELETQRGSCGHCGQIVTVEWTWPSGNTMMPPQLENGDTSPGNASSVKADSNQVISIDSRMAA